LTTAKARRLLPVGDDVGHLRIIRIDRLHDGEPAGTTLARWAGSSSEARGAREGNGVHAEAVADLVEALDEAGLAEGCR
jgi:hypothetical protein